MAKNVLDNVHIKGTLDIDSTLKIGGTTVTATAAELNIMHGVTSSTAELNIVDGVTATAAELNLTDDMAASAVYSIAAGAVNEAVVSIQIKDAAGVVMTRPVMFDIWLSDASTGIGLTATTASGAVQASGNGTDVVTLVSKKMLKAHSSAAGLYTLSITDTAHTGFYVVIALPGKGNFQVSSQLVVGNYGV